MIYPKNEMIEQLLASAVNEETGELVFTDEELAEKLAAIDIEFDESIKALRNSYLTDMMDANCIAAEASAIWKYQQEVSKRAKAVENRANRTKRFIAYLLKGEKFDKDGVKIGYRKSEETVIDDRFVEWAKKNAPEFLDSKVRTADVKAAIKAGQEFEFAHIEQKNNIQVK